MIDTSDVLTDDARAFLLDLEREFGARRAELLVRRAERLDRLHDGELPDFLPETAEVRAGDWRVAPTPDEIADRRVEITGPVDRKMVINALNSGARVFMADFEDSNSPTWSNCIEGQRNLTDALDRTISLDTGDKQYSLDPDPAVLFVRPRGWHLVERHHEIDGAPMSASLFDFGLYFFRNHGRNGRYFYLPKLESHLEARLWNDVFTFAQARLGVPNGTIKATVLIETILAAFEMDEILYELRDHSAGLNAGRWDYIFSVIKKLGHRPEMVLPDRGDVTMAVPFMRSYCELLVKTCHRRGAFAMGGMAAFIPSRRDADVNAVALAKVREDKEREASQGFDGTWVAHPDLVSTAYEAFDAVLGEAPNQIGRQRDDVSVGAGQLLDIAATPGAPTEDGLRNNVSVGIQYLAAWLEGSGAVAINNLMEDAATAEISRSQIWQWLHHGRFTADDVLRITDEEIAEARPRLRRRANDLREHRHPARLRRVSDAPRLRPAHGGRLMRAVFVGGSSGIGLAAARRAAAAGWDVVVASRDPGRADVDAERVVLDIADQASVREVFGTLGPIDHLVFSPVARAGGPAKSIDLEAARRAFEIKLWGPFAAVQAADVRESIVFVSGVAATTPMRGGSATAAVNGAIEALVRTLAVELAPVRVNAVSPGIIDTPTWDPMAADDRKAMFDRLAGALPAGRIGAAEELGEAIWLLLTNGYMTGTVLPVDGGHRLAAP